MGERTNTQILKHAFPRTIH